MFGAFLLQNIFQQSRSFTQIYGGLHSPNIQFLELRMHKFYCAELETTVVFLHVSQRRWEELSPEFRARLQNL